MALEKNNVAGQFPEIREKLEKMMKEARVESPFWNLASKGFNAKAACEANGVEPFA